MKRVLCIGIFNPSVLSALEVPELNKVYSVIDEKEIGGIRGYLLEGITQFDLNGFRQYWIAEAFEILDDGRPKDHSPKPVSNHHSHRPQYGPNMV